MKRRTIDTSPSDTPQYEPDFGKRRTKFNRKNNFSVAFIFVMAIFFLVNYIEKKSTIDTIISEVNVRQPTSLSRNNTNSLKTHINKVNASHLHQLVDMDCSKDDQRTVRCPLGNRTPPDYHKNMKTIYSYTDPDLIQLYLKCLDLSLPLKTTDPVECWPHIFILPSHATNGSGLARTLLTKVIGMQLMMNHYNEVDAKQLYNLTTLDHNGFEISSPLKDATLPLPIMKRAAIFKSHITQSERPWKRSTKLIEGSAEQMANGKGGGISGIIRLTRNPGDQILRNTFRWQHKTCYSEGDECFFKNAKKSCRSVRFQANKHYKNFHSFWNQYEEKIPQTFFHYERFSNLTHVDKAINDVLRFLNATSRGVNYMEFYSADISEQLKDIVKEPKYEHGTILARVCGKQLARDIHEMTKGLTERIGYLFDYESATWSVDPRFFAKETVENIE